MPHSTGLSSSTNINKHGTEILDKFRVYNNVVHQLFVVDRRCIDFYDTISIDKWMETDKGQWVCKHSPCITYKSYMDENLGFLRITFVAYLTPSDYTFFTLKFST